MLDTGKLATVNNATFKKGQRVTYQDKGVGRIIDIGSVEAGGMYFQAYTISFDGGFVVKIPCAKVATSGLRPISNQEQLPEIIRILKDTAKVSRLHWQARATKLNEKLKSGSLMGLAEIVRDLHRDDNSQSYSERQFYLSACQVLIDEVAEIKQISAREATQFLIDESGKSLQYMSGKIEVLSTKQTPSTPRIKAKDSLSPKVVEPTKLERTTIKKAVVPRQLRQRTSKESQLTLSKKVQLDKLRSRNNELERRVSRLSSEIVSLTKKLELEITSATQPLMLRVSELEQELVVLAQHLYDKNDECLKLQEELKMVKEKPPIVEVEVVPTPKTSAPTTKLARGGMVRRPDGSWWNPNWMKK